MINSPSSQVSDCWKKLKIAILGGDDREQQIAKLAAETGAQVTAFGFPWPDDGIDGVVYTDSPKDCLDGANIALMPIPGIATDGSLFATEKIIPDRQLLAHMAKDSHIILGIADQSLNEAATGLGIGIHEYEHDQELMLLRAPAIVEAALKIIVENTAITIHNAQICVVGQGNIGTLLARTLKLIGAHVTVAARNPIQRATAYTFGAIAISLTELDSAATNFQMLFSTVPAPVVDSAIIDQLPPDALVMDLSAPPGGVDLDYATASGRKAIWARGLGRRAPITVGNSQWTGIKKMILNILETD